MRRVTSLLASILLLMPVGLASAGSAAAATGSLTVIAIGRDGASVSTPVQVTGTTVTGGTYWITSGRAATVPRGTWDVMADIFNPRDQTDTLGAMRVTVAGTTRVVLDARRGQAVRPYLSPAAPSGYRLHFYMSLCSKISLDSVDAFTYGAVLYLIPTTLSSIKTVFHPVWEPYNPNSHGPRFFTTTIDQAGIPSGGTRIYRQSSLAAVRVSLRRGPETGTPISTLQAETSDNCGNATGQLTTQANLPTYFVAHVTPGQWSAREQGQDSYSSQPRTYLAGHSYSLDINRSAWGPSGQLPYVRSAGRLGRLYPSTIDMFADPVLDFGVGATTTYRLSRAGRTVLTGRTNSYGATTIVSSPGWYDYTAAATRHPRTSLPADVLSAVSSVVLHFHVDPTRSEQIKGYLTRLLPQGLNAYDRAKAGSYTTVNLSLLRKRPTDPDITQPADAPSRIEAWASQDGGRTWHALGVRKNGSVFAAVIHNGRSGFVSLRSTVIDTSGNTTTTTVFRAYALA